LGMQYQVSYQARLPSPATVRVSVENGLEVVLGEWGDDKRDWFSEFRSEGTSGPKQQRSKEPKQPVHIEFLRCRPEAKSIAAFTKKWGALAAQPVKKEHPDRRYLGRIPDGRRFCISISAWNDYHSKLKEIWRMLTKPLSVADRDRVAQFRSLF